MVKSVDKVADKWVKRVSVASTDYTEGISNPSRDWAARTEAAKARYTAGVQQAIAAGTREAGVRRTGTSGWKSKALAKSDRYASGVQGAESDFREAMGQVLAFEDSLQKKVNAMPDATLEDRIKKSAEWQREMAKFRRS
jgi:hypothetical protein